MRPRARCLFALAGVMAVVVSACSGGGSRDSAPSTPSRPAFDAGYQSATYSNPAHWLCRPDLPPAQSACAGDLSVTSVAPDGKLTVERASSASHAPVDCFYVYPTVDTGRGPNEDIDASHAAEISVTRTQAAPFGRLCSMFPALFLHAIHRTLSSPYRRSGLSTAHLDIHYAFSLSS